MSRLRAVIGFRGMFLLALSLYALMFGLYFLVGGALAHPVLLPNETWGLIWTIGGGIVAAGAVLPRHDRWFFAVAALIQAAWAAEYVRVAVRFGSVNWPRAGYYAAGVLFILITAAWPEPARAVISEEAVKRAEEVSTAQATARTEDAKGEEDGT